MAYFAIAVLECQGSYLKFLAASVLTILGDVHLNSGALRFDQMSCASLGLGLETDGARVRKFNISL